MFIEVKPPRDGLKYEGKRSRRGRIVETLFVVLALMCLPVLLFGQWFVGEYGNPATIAANAAEAAANRNQGGGSSDDSDTKNEGNQGEDDEGSHDEDAHDEDAHDEGSHDEDAHDEDAHELHDEHSFEVVESEGEATAAPPSDGTDSSPGLGGDLIAGVGDDPMEADPPAVAEDPMADAMESRTDVNPFSDEPDSDTTALLGSNSDLDGPPIETLPVTPPMEEEPLAEPLADNGSESDLDLNSAPMDLSGSEASELAVDADPEPAVEPMDSVVSADGNPSATELNLDTMLSDPPQAEPVEETVPQTRTWTRRDNGRTVKAVFIRAERVDGNVFVFIAAPGKPKEYKLPLDLLSDVDVEYVKDTVRRAKASE